MGATNFYCISAGSNASEAFNKAVKEAQWEHGHGGYTGTIGEKSTFSMASDQSLSHRDAASLAESLLYTDYRDKWGDAGCIPLILEPKPNSSDALKQKKEQSTFLFFGWASN